MALDQGSKFEIWSHIAVVIRDIAMQLEAHVLNRASTNLAAILPEVLSLSNEIFSADPSTKYASLQYWTEQLSHDSSTIIYLTSIASDGQDGDSYTSKPIAFLFVHPRAHSLPLKHGGKETLHLWLAGVLPEWRKMGCLERMTSLVMTDPSLTYTVCTTPSRFPVMWAWLLKRGWKHERDLGEGKIMLSKEGECNQ
ncbi:hypothetical protein BC835DRAFT_9393 [Cytidiella melzeri]|nr:hypothetical protein BC835DRAFT_9393 [Cytidiella melzeri]